jgi:protease-4
MSQALILLAAGLGFFSSSSVSFVERSDAVWTNPAGRALHSEGIELRSGMAFFEDAPGFQIGLSVASVGFGYRSGDSTGVWTAGFGIPLHKRFRLGGAYFWGEQRFWRFGLQANPLNWIALGAALQTGETSTIIGGLGVRPFTDRVTLFSDLSYRGGFDDLKVGLGVEPVSGILLSGTVTQPLNGEEGLSWTAGTEFGLTYVKLGATYNSDGALGINLGFSFPRYPGIRLKRPGPKVVAWVPKGRPEEPAPSGFKFAFISFSMKKSRIFYDLLRELRSLVERKDVKGVLLDFRGARFSLYQAEEIRAELTQLKEGELKIVAFSDGYSLGSYYLASIADKIWMVPTGKVSFVGMYAQTIHIKGTLDKLGIEPDFYRVGEYKSAYELFEFSQPSDEDKEQLEAYLASLYDEILGAIERDRDISRAEFEKIMNERIIVDADTAKMLGLVDGLCLALELDSIIKEEFGEKAERIKLAELKKKPKEIARAWVESKEKSVLTKQDKIAIVVAEGEIVTGESGSNPIPIPLIGGKHMGSTTISEALDKVKTDKQVKAVVFRINSGGGSALASEIINRALAELAAEKPVIVSMAGVAGSGGYYIAAPANKIYADATTITGSIGILGGKFVSKDLREKLGINRETVKLYPHSDMFSSDRRFDEAEVELMQRMMDEGYAEFVNRVAEGRGMTFDEVDSVARGRIWSGPDAVEAGLADEVGGLMDALEEARKMAGLPEDCRVIIYPEPEPMIDIEEVLDETSILNLKMLPSWLSENLLYLMPYQIEVPIR